MLAIFSENSTTKLDKHNKEIQHSLGVNTPEHVDKPVDLELNTIENPKKRSYTY